MGSRQYDVIGIGNAIVDVIAKASDSFVADQGLAKGSMALIDQDRADELYGLMGPGVEVSGGSVANSVAGVASFGGTAAFVGKVADDALGRVFAHDIRASGVAFDSDPAQGGPQTARSLLLVTPDAQRTMNTCLGIAGLLEPADIDVDLIKQGQILFCEGYIWDVESAKQAVRLAMDVATDAGSTVALTISDPFCVERHHQEFLDLIEGPVQLLFANEAELAALYGCKFDDAIELVRDRVELGCLTRGERGSVLVSADQTIEIPAFPTEVVDTTGAGDQYAAGVLYAVSKGLGLHEAGRLGARAASEVISHFGSRPSVPLHTFIE